MGIPGLIYLVIFPQLITSKDITYSQPVFEFVKILEESSTYKTSFRPFRDGKLTNLNFFRIKELDEVI